MFHKDKSNLEDVINSMKTQYKAESKKERNELHHNKLVNRSNNKKVIETKSKAKNKKE